MAKKRKLSKKDVDQLMPVVKEYNRFAKTFIRLLGLKVAQKEKKISVMVSRIANPKSGTSHINVKTVEFSNSFLKRQKKNKTRSSDFDENFSSRRGHMI